MAFPAREERWGEKSLLQGLLTTWPPECFISSQGKRYQLADASEGHCWPGVTWAGMGGCFLAVLPLFVVCSPFLSLCGFSRIFSWAPRAVACGWDTSALAYGLWHAGCSPQEELAPGSLSTDTHPGQNVAPSLFSSGHTFLSLLPVLLIHFSPLGNKAFLTSVTSNTQKAGKNFWVGGSLCCTAPCLPACGRLARSPLPVRAAHRMWLIFCD